MNTTTTPAPPVLTVDDAAVRWLEAGRPFAEATIVEATNSAPVPVGGQMLVASEDEFLGSVSGGCVETDVISMALDVIADGKPRGTTFGIEEERAWRAGLPCGSTIRVFVTRPEPEASRKAIAAVAELRRKRKAVVIATDLASGERRFYDGDASPPEYVMRALAARQSMIVEDEGREIFLHVLLPPPRIVAVGATHLAQILEAMAKAAGYDVLVIDPRSAFTSATRFDAETAITGWPEQNLKPYADDPYTAIAALTHVGHIDDEALKIAMRSNCRYIGALGSRRTHAERVKRLKAAGFTDAEIARIHAPIGLEIGARTPGEIATSVLAQIVAAFNAKPPA